MATSWITFDLSLDTTRSRTSLRNCTSESKCLLERPPKCLPVQCDTTQFNDVMDSCPVL
jgi:hypothetical protein